MVIILMTAVTAVLALLWQWNESKVADGFSNTHARKLKNNALAFLAVLPCYIVFSLQYSMHSDYDNYLRWFYQIKSGTYEIRDPSINFIFKFVARLGLDFQVVLFVIYAIAFFLLILCIRKYSTQYASSIVLFISVFFMLAFLQIRQLVAVLLILYAYDYIAEKKLIKFMVFVLIAATFHTSALIMVPFYFILQIKFKLSHFIVIAALMAFVSLFNEHLLVFVTKTFFSNYYGRHEMYAVLTFNKIEVAMQLVVMVLIILYGKDLKDISKRDKIFLNAFFCQFIIFFFGRFVVSLERFLFFLLIPIIMLIPSLISQTQNKNQRFLLQIIFPAVMFLLMLMRYRYSDILLNYKTIFLK